jgi:hypothetical protein
MFIWGDGDGAWRGTTRYDDHYVRGYWGFLRELQTAYSEGRQQQQGPRNDINDSHAVQSLFAKKPGWFYLHQLCHAADGEQRALIEARLLAGESDAQIASRLGTIPHAIEVYHKLRYDVRDRLDSRDWIASAVLKPPPPTTRRDGIWTDEQRHWLYRTIAYHGGSLALDVAIQGCHPGPGPQQASDVGPWLRSMLASIVKVKAVTAMQAFDVSKFTQMHLGELGLNVSTVESVEASQELNQLESAMAELMKEIPWELALREKRTPLQERYVGPVQPRAGEQLLLAAGVEPPELAEFLRRRERHSEEEG